MADRSRTPLGVLSQGALAGAMGTLAMDLAQYARYRAGDGRQGFVEWEFRGVNSFEGAPAPAQIAKRIFEAMTQRELSDEHAGMANNLMHWSYGIAWGSARALLVGSRTRNVKFWSGALFGTSVWLMDYMALPITGLYKPMWEYDAKTLGKDLGDHVVYGMVSGLVLRALTGRR